MTDFETMCEILGEFWSEYRDFDDLKEFVGYNDLGLPLAYFLMNEIVLPTSQSELYINETYDLFIASLQVADKEWESLDELLGDQA